MTKITLEPVRLVDRPRSPAIEAAAPAHGYTPLQSRLLAGRMRCQDSAGLGQRVRPPVTALTSPESLPDIEQAAEAISSAIIDGRPFCLNSDFDCDGITASATVYTALRDYFGVAPDRLHRVVAIRRREGYGLSRNVAHRIISTVPRGAQVITLDHGSADCARVTELVDAGYQVIVADHHELDGRGPEAAIAVVNPMRDDGHFPDQRIAGVHVAWLTCCAVRQRLIERGHLPRTAPRLGALLDYVGLGALADCSDLALSVNNRAVVNTAIERMNANARPCWTAFRRLARLSGPYNSSTLSFTLAPSLNARGRIDDSTLAIDFLLAPTEQRALELGAELITANEQRKAIQAAMLDRTTPQALQAVADGYTALTILDEAGHSGVNGVCASRIVELTGRPCAFFSPKFGPDNLMTGSLRTVPGIHIRDALAEVAVQLGSAMKGHGGHEGAGGCTVDAAAVPAFREAFQRAVEAQRPNLKVGPRILTDGELPVIPSLAAVAEIEALAPWGRTFEQPAFRMRATASKLSLIGQDKSHLRLALTDERGAPFEAVWFGAAKGGRVPVADGQRVDIVYELDANTFRQETRLQLRVRHGIPVS